MPRDTGTTITLPPPSTDTTTRRGEALPPPPPPPLQAACQVKIEYLLADPSTVYVYPLPDFCTPGLEVALAAAVAAILKAGYAYPFPAR